MHRWSHQHRSKDAERNGSVTQSFALSFSLVNGDTMRCLRNVKEKRIWSVLLVLGLVLGLTSMALAKYEVLEVKNGATIRGMVTWKGHIPEFEPLKVNANRNFCGKNSPQRALQVDAKSKGLRFVLVYLEEVLKGKAPKKKYWLHVGKADDRPDSDRCTFEEHVFPFVRTQAVALTNFDKVLHSPHGFSESHAILFNVDLSEPKKETDEHFKRVHGVGLQYNCDIHVTMNGWMAGFEHPYFSVTDTKGSYEISDIPPGHYNLVAWHEGYRIIKFKSGRPVYDDPHVLHKVVEVKEGEAIEINFAFPVQ